MNGDGRQATFDWRFLLGAVLLVAVAVTGNALFSARQPTGMKLLYFAGGTLVLIASIASGILLGFLFGLPKTLQIDVLGAENKRYLANTNLEQISDWLTKILVGIGLVQLGQASEKLSAFASRIGPIFGETGASGGYGLAVCTYGVILGFLVAYLWTRTALPEIFEEADVLTSMKRALASRERANTTASSLVSRQLEDQAPVDPKELQEAVAKATPEWLVLIYRRAEEQRARNWRDEKAQMELTIPVFEALVLGDKNRQFHRHFGSLGYAMKDKRVPDYDLAIKYLSDAISIRGPDPIDSGYARYEWCRALCRIKMNPAPAVQSPETKKQIWDDLDKAEKAGMPQEFFVRGQDQDVNLIADWRAQNPVPVP